MVTDGCFTSQIFVAYYTCSPSHYMDHTAKTLERVLMAIGRSPSCPYQLKKEHTHTKQLWKLVHRQSLLLIQVSSTISEQCGAFNMEHALSKHPAGKRGRPGTWTAEGLWRMLEDGETLVKHWWNTGETSAWHCGQSWELAKGAGGAEQTELQLTVSELQIPMTVRCQCRCISCIEDYEELQSSA